MKDSVVKIGSLELKFLVDENDGAGDLIMFEFTVPSNARVPVPHYHRDVDEAVYGLDGVLTTVSDGKPHEVRPGDTVFIPRGVVHHHENPHSETARALILLTPGSIGKRYFEEMAETVNVAGPPDVERVKEIMHQYGLIPA